MGIFLGVTFVGRVLAGARADILPLAGHPPQGNPGTLFGFNLRKNVNDATGA
jgi:hypothetical protein